MPKTSGVASADALVGRETELALAATAVRELDDGRASALAIEGEAGIGKTRLVQSIVDDARARDLTVLWGQAHPFERTRPFGVVAAALGLSRRSPDPRRAAIGGLLAGEGGGDVQYRVVEEIVELVETACAERPVLLVAEDLQWANRREPAGDHVGGPAAPARGAARCRDGEAVAAAGRSRPSAG